MRLASGSLEFASVVAVVFGLLQVGCAAGRPFTNSSIDFNRGEQHRLVLKGDFDAVQDAVASVMAERHATLYRRRHTDRGSVVLSFRVEAERKRGSRSSGGAFSIGSYVASEVVTTNEYLKFGALYFLEFTRAGGTVSVEALGLPVVDGYTACPAVARERYIECTEFAATSTQGFAEAAEEEYGVSVDGAREAAMISGLFAELQRKKWRDAYSPAPAEPRSVAPRAVAPTATTPSAESSADEDQADDQAGEAGGDGSLR